METGARDWNARDAVRSAPGLGLGTRFGLRLSSPRSALRALESATDAGDARAHNLLEGLAERAGVEAPQLHIYRGPPNALAAPGRRAAVGIADSALRDLARTELEAVLAHCVVRIAFLPRIHPVGYDDDVRTVALTRYPPGLAAALAKLTPRRGPGAHWFTAAEAASHRPVAARVAALEEL